MVGTVDKLKSGVQLRLPLCLFGASRATPSLVLQPGPAIKSRSELRSFPKFKNWTLQTRNHASSTFSYNYNIQGSFY